MSELTVGELSFADRLRVFSVCGPKVELVIDATRAREIADALDGAQRAAEVQADADRMRRDAERAAREALIDELDLAKTLAELREDTALRRVTGVFWWLGLLACFSELFDLWAALVMGVAR